MFCYMHWSILSLVIVQCILYSSVDIILWMDELSDIAEICKLISLNDVKNIAHLLQWQYP